MTRGPGDSKLHPGHKPKQLHARLSQGASFDFRALHTGFEMDNMALGRIFLPALQLSPASSHYTNVTYSLIIEEMYNALTHTHTHTPPPQSHKL